MVFAAYIARRLSLRPTGEDNKRQRSPGAVIAVTGIALAIAIMLMAVAIVTGFKHEIRAKVTGFNAEITVYPSAAFSDTVESPGLQITPALKNTISQVAPGATASLIVRQPAIFKTDNAFEGIVLKGMQDSGDSDFISESIVDGQPLPAHAVDSLLNTVVISRATADALHLSTGKKIDVHFLRDNTIATRRLTVRGIYDTHFSEYDRMFAFTPIEFLQRFARVDSLTGSAVEIRGIEAEQIAGTASQLERSLLYECVNRGEEPAYIVDNVLRSSAIYFNWLDLLDTNVAVIIILMTLVASFTLISSLFIIILERVSMIGLFKALGATNAQIRRIFILLAERLVLMGLIAGNVVGLGLLALQKHFHIVPLDPEAYYLNYVPAEIDWTSVAIIDISALIVAFAVLILPSAAISRMSPAETLRWE